MEAIQNSALALASERVRPSLFPHKTFKYEKALIHNRLAIRPINNTENVYEIYFAII